MGVKYAIVRENDLFSQGYKFTKWHETPEEARVEAGRLAKKERAPFVVLKTIALARPSEPPVEFIDL